MSAADDFREIVARLRSWGFTISEMPGCYGRSNGLNWARGVPVGHINHHYVCSLNPAQSYIDDLVARLVAGRTVTWFADVNGRGYLNATGPTNHAGVGNSSVLARTTAGLSPTGPAPLAGDMTGNTFYSGTELQHPGDSTPYPLPMVDLMVAISAAEAMQWGWTAARIINHFEWTGRKIDMSLWGGRAAGMAQGQRMRAAVADRMQQSGHGKPAVKPDPDEPTPTDDTEDDDMLSTIQAADGPNKGTIYVVGPNHWHGIENIEAYEQGVAAGVLKPVRSVANQRALDVARAIALQLTEGEHNISVAS